MIIYNVTVKVDYIIHAAWLAWMKASYIPRKMATGLFNDYRICRLLDQDEQEGVTYVLQYTLDTLVHFRHYEEYHASSLHEEFTARFGDQCVAFRTLMEVMD